MPLKRLRLQAKAKAARGTAGAAQMVELMTENWATIQEAFQSSTGEEQEGLVDHFNNVIDELGDVLFGDDCTPGEFKDKIALCDEE